MSKVEGIEFLYKMFERKGWDSIRLKDMEMILITVIEMEREKEVAKT
jgi:hypothetical protein